MADRHIFGTEAMGSHNVARPVVLTIEGWSASKLILTSLTGSSDVNYQVNYALNDDAHILVFGERLSVLNIAGIAVGVKQGAGSCSTVTPDDFIKFYKANRMDSDSDALRIGFGGTVVKGYFVGLNAELAGGQDFSFRFNFKFLGQWQW